MFRTPTGKLVAGFVVAIVTLGLIAMVALTQIRMLRELQEDVIDRNRLDSVQLLKVQNSLNSLALLSRDMAAESTASGIPAYRERVDRIIAELDEGLRREESLAPPWREPSDSREMAASLKQLRDLLDAAFLRAEASDFDGSHAAIRGPVYAEQDRLASRVERLLVANYEDAETIAERAAGVHASTERTVLVFVFSLILIVIGYGTNSVVYNRRVLRHLEELSAEKGDLARQMIGLQENILRSVSRDLHDDFGQILTAVNAILARVRRKAGDQLDPSLAEQIGEVHDATRQALERARDLSQTLHPALLDSHGLEGAVDRFLPGYERQTGIRVHFEGKDSLAMVPKDNAIHVYRIIQESLSNVSRHAKTDTAWVRANFDGKHLAVEIEDHGTGIERVESQSGHRSAHASGARLKSGLGLVAMSERAQILGGSFATEVPPQGGTRIRVQIPIDRKGLS